MSAQNEGSTAQVTVVLTKEPSFLDDKIDLNTLRLALKRHSAKAVDTMVKILDDTTASIDLKYKVAKDLLGLQVSVASEISKDQMARLIAELKLNPGGRKTLTELTDETGDEDDTPMVDFDNIRQV